MSAISSIPAVDGGAVSEGLMRRAERAVSRVWACRTGEGSANSRTLQCSDRHFHARNIKETPQVL